MFCRTAAAKPVQASVNTIIGPRFSIFGPPRESPVSPGAIDPEEQERLWAESLRVTGVDYFGI